MLLRGHRYRPNYGETGHDSDYDSEDEGEEKVHSVWQKSHHTAKCEYTLTQVNDDPDPSLQRCPPTRFSSKIPPFCKTRYKPVLTEEAREAIASRYAEMRSRQNDAAFPITARSLETVIRLASAHAKARLSNIVEAVPDVKIAMDILGYALYHESNPDGQMEIEQHPKRQIPEVSDDR
jgi:DNA replication licensing factor MCM3